MTHKELSYNLFDDKSKAKKDYSWIRHIKNKTQKNIMKLIKQQNDDFYKPKTVNKLTGGKHSTVFLNLNG